MDPDKFLGGGHAAGCCHLCASRDCPKSRSFPSSWGQWLDGLGSDYILTPYLSRDSSSIWPTHLPASDVIHLRASLGLPWSGTGGGVGVRSHSLKGSGPPAEVQGAFPILVRDVGVGSCHQQLMDTGDVARSTGLVQGGAAPRGTVRLCPPPQQ